MTFSMAVKAVRARVVDLGTFSCELPWGQRTLRDRLRTWLAYRWLCIRCWWKGDYTEQHAYVKARWPLPACPPPPPRPAPTPGCLCAWCDPRPSTKASA